MQTKLHHFAPDELSSRQLGDRFANFPRVALSSPEAVAEGKLGDSRPLALAVQEDAVPAVGDDHLGGLLDRLESVLPNHGKHVLEVSPKNEDAPERRVDRQVILPMKPRLCRESEDR
jgi:hypothetical protein